MFERFTAPARQAVQRAQAESGELRHDRIGPEHLLLALLAEPTEPGAATLAGLGLGAESARAAVVRLRGPAGGLGEEDAAALRSLGIDLDEVRRRAEENFGPGALDTPPAPRRRFFGLVRGRREPGTGHLPFTAEAKKALELSLREAVHRGDRHIGTEHLLLGLLRGGDLLTLAVLREAGTDPRTVRRALDADLGREAA